MNYLMIAVLGILILIFFAVVFGFIFGYRLLKVFFDNVNTRQREMRDRLEEKRTEFDKDKKQGSRITDHRFKVD